MSIPQDWKGQSWEELTSEAQTGLRGQGALVEAMRRLTERLQAASTSSDKYSRRMFWLNIILTVLTLVQVAAVIKSWR